MKKPVLFWHSNIRHEFSFSYVWWGTLQVWSDEWRKGLKSCGSKLVVSSKGQDFRQSMKLQLEVVTEGRGNRARRRGWIDRGRIETGKRLDELGRKQERDACERLELIEPI